MAQVTVEKLYELCETIDNSSNKSEVSLFKFLNVIAEFFKILINNLATK